MPSGGNTNVINVGYPPHEGVEGEVSQRYKIKKSIVILLQWIFNK